MSKSVKFLTLFVALLLVAGLALAFPGAGAGGADGGSQAAAPAGTVLTGKVTETMDAGGYTYLSLDSNDKKSWVAIPLTPVNVGDEVKVAGGMIMSNFTSKTLNRTFEAIIFSKGIVQ